MGIELDNNQEEEKKEPRANLQDMVNPMQGKVRAQIGSHPVMNGKLEKMVMGRNQKTPPPDTGQQIVSANLGNTQERDNDMSDE